MPEPFCESNCTGHQWLINIGKISLLSFETMTIAPRGTSRPSPDKRCITFPLSVTLPVKQGRGLEHNGSNSATPPVWRVACRRNHFIVGEQKEAALVTTATASRGVFL
jgi:hypothetical protein